MKYEKYGKILEDNCVIGNHGCLKGQKVWTIIDNGIEILHRESWQPSLINTWNDILCEYYFFKGKLHNENGPAYIEYKNFNEKVYCEYYLNNKFIFKTSDFSEGNIIKNNEIFKQNLIDYKMDEVWG